MPHLTDFKINDPLLAGKFPHQLGLLRRINIFIRNKMVRHHDDFFRIKDFHAQSAEFPDSDRRGDIIGQHHINFTIDKFTGADLFFAGMGCQNFFC